MWLADSTGSVNTKRYHGWVWEEKVNLFGRGKGVLLSAEFSYVLLNLLAMKLKAQHLQMELDCINTGWETL